MWGGRFAEGPGAIMQAINASVDVDVRLIEHDVVGSKAHAAMLAEAGIIARADADALKSWKEAAALKQIKKTWKVEVDNFAKLRVGR